MSQIDLEREPQARTIDRDDGVAPGRGTLTSRLVPPSRQTLVFRVESAEAANALADRFAARDANGVAAGADVEVARAASSSGSSLPVEVQRKFEASTGADLSGVRVHTGSESASAASAVGARAYTTGQDIHFADGQYRPGDPFGLHLLAHEVAHTVQQSGGARRMQAKLEVSSPGDAAEVEADRAADAMVGGQLALIGGSSGVARQIARKDNADTQTCDQEENQSHADTGGTCEDPNAGGEKKEGEDPDIAAKVKPLKIAGMDLGLKVNKDGFKANLSKSVSIELPPVPVCPGVTIVFEPKVTASIGVTWTKAAGWAGEVGLAGSFGVFVRGGTPFAYVQGGVELGLPLKSTITDAGMGPLKGDLTGELKVEAALKVPWSGKNDKTPNLKKPEGWANSGGVSFEYVIASAKFIHIEISTEGVTASWVGPDIGSHINALEAAKADYDRNIAGGGAEGGPAASPNDPQPDDGAGGAATDRRRNAGGNGAGGAPGY
jgi:hypothetical protein